jgi:hypothetical protein
MTTTSKIFNCYGDFVDFVVVIILGLFNSWEMAQEIDDIGGSSELAEDISD